MPDLLVECPIHLDAVSITDILVFKCGHGFCELCLEEHFAHHAQLGHVLCPSCRKPIKRKEAFPLFLTPAQSSPGSNDQPHETSHTRMKTELKETKAALANSSGRLTELQHEMDTLRQTVALHDQMLQHLRHGNELLKEQLAKAKHSFAHAREEYCHMKEEAVKLQVENHKKSRALEQALEEVQRQRERVKMFQDYIEQYKQKYNLERRKRKAIENANDRLLPKKEDDSLMVVDSNAPDMLHRDGPSFGWLDEACEVEGDQLSVREDEDVESNRGSEDEVQLGDEDTRENGEDDRAPPSLQFHSEWNLGPETLAGPSPGVTRKQKHGNRRLGGSRIVKVKMSVRSGSHRTVDSPLDIDRQGRLKGTVVLGSRQKLNSKN